MRARAYDVGAALVSLVEVVGAALVLTYGGVPALLVVLAVTVPPYVATLVWLGRARRRARLEQLRRDRAFLRTSMLEVIAAGEQPRRKPKVA